MHDLVQQKKMKHCVAIKTFYQILNEIC